MTAAVQNPLLMGAIAFLSLARPRTTMTPIADATMPMAGTMSGKMTARARVGPERPAQ